jgi:hypothetical protein
LDIQDEGLRHPFGGAAWVLRRPALTPRGCPRCR